MPTPIASQSNGVVYLNGSEIFRINMTNEVSNPITYTDFAGGAGDYGVEVFSIDPALLNIGDNTVAVEIHQGNLTSSDISMAFALVGLTAEVVLPIELTILGDTLNTLDLTSNLLWMEGDNFNIFEKLVNLEHLYLDDNFLVYDNGLPPQLGQLTKLKRLRLSYNLLGGQLEGQFPILDGMSQLTHLVSNLSLFCLSPYGPLAP